MLPSLDVVVPARNATRTLGRCINSLLGSDYPAALRVIVVDDGSTDGTADLVEELAENDARLSCVTQPPAGVNAARNRGITEGEADLVAFIDSDEWVDGDHLARAAALLRGHPDVVAVGGPCRDVGADHLHRCPRCIGGSVRLPIDTRGEAVELFGGNLVVRRSAFAEVGMFDAALSGLGDETEWFRRGQGHRFLYDPELVVYHEFSDARLIPLLRKRFRQGRTLPTFRRRAGEPPPRLGQELIGALGHMVRHRCGAPLERMAALAGDLSARRRT